MKWNQMEILECKGNQRVPLPSQLLPSIFIVHILTPAVVVSLPQGRIQENKRMKLVNFTHGLFLTCTQKSRYIYKSLLAIFTECTAFPYFHPTDPLQCWSNNPALLTWRASFFAHGDECPSTLVSGLPTTAPPLGFYPSHPFTPHISNYIICIDDINNLGRPHPGQ